MAWPRIGSTGLVNEVPVLWAGTSSRQTASGRTVGVAGDRVSVVLPADAPGAEPRYLVAALPGEQPGQCHRADSSSG